jgi:glucoamylase
VVPETRVLRSAPDPDQLAEQQRLWIRDGAGWTRKSTRWAGLVESASLDLYTLTIASPAPVAGWSSAWRYVWPRDSAHAAAALARTGRADQAIPIMQFLQRVQHPSGWFEARYLPDGSGPPDNRPRQLDGTGWALWALGEVVDHLPVERGVALASSMRPLVDRCLSLIASQTSSPSGLPAPSPDYWEVPEHTLTLGTVAPLAAGLWGAQKVLARLGESARTRAAADQEYRLRKAIDTGFRADGYPRHLGGDDPDVATAFLLPPYAPNVNTAALDALAATEARIRRVGDGLAPGTSWKSDGIAWTPETALVAMANASSGRQDDATRLLTWLEHHRTNYGSVSEKVIYTGAPAGPAPLSWTAALVILALEALSSNA